MATSKLYGGLTIKTEFSRNKKTVTGLFHNEEIVLEYWEDIAAFGDILGCFVASQLHVDHTYKICDLVISIRKHGPHYMLRIDYRGNTFDFEKVECRICSQIINRVLARSDLLAER